MGQPVVVENVPGANGIIGMRTAKSAPNGYTISIDASAILKRARNPELRE